jgi:hypothetical protein
MKYGLFESASLDCDHEIILEEPADKYVLQMWCEDCLAIHSFNLVEKFDSVEEVWIFLREEI